MIFLHVNVVYFTFGEGHLSGIVSSGHTFLLNSFWGVIFQNSNQLVLSGMNLGYTMIGSRQVTGQNPTIDL